VTAPQSFGRYRVTGSLGAGAMGEVLAAVDELLGREVAVKTLKGRTSGLAARMADERFRLEARAIASLTHPSVVQVYDLDLTADPPYLVMERVAGPSLKDRIAQGPLPEHELRALGIQMANALATAHARGVVHRDVKPANILGAGPGTWKLADFGVAHVPDSSLTMTGQFVGSPAYAPPEALIRGQLGPEGDVFGLGATLYQAAAGTWPRADAETRGLLAAVPPILSIAPHVPPDVAAVIDRAVAVEPAARPSAAELALALAGGTLAGVHPAPVGATPPAGAAVVAPAAAGAAPFATAFVPDHPPGAYGAATSGSHPTATGGPYTAPISGPYATSTASAIGAVSLPTSTSTSASGQLAAHPPTKSRWKYVAIGLAALLVIVLIAATRGSPSGPGGIVTSSPGKADPKQAGGNGSDGSDERDGSDEGDGGGGEHDEGDGSPKLIRAKTPQLTTEEAARDWRRVVDKLYEQRFGEARQRLAEWETKYGETEETRDLAKQLDGLPEDALRVRGRGRKKYK